MTALLPVASAPGGTPLLAAVDLARRAAAVARGLPSWCSTPVLPERPRLPRALDRGGGLRMAILKRPENTQLKRSKSHCPCPFWWLVPGLRTMCLEREKMTETPQ